MDYGIRSSEDPEAQQLGTPAAGRPWPCAGPGSSRGWPSSTTAPMSSTWPASGASSRLQSRSDHSPMRRPLTEGSADEPRRQDQDRGGRPDTSERPRRRDHMRPSRALDTLQAAFPASIAVCKELATHDDAAVRAGRERYSGSPRRERADSRVNPGKRSRTPSTRPSRNCLQPEATRQSDHSSWPLAGPPAVPSPRTRTWRTGNRISRRDQRPDVADACRPAPMPGPRPESEKTSLALAMARGEPIAAWARENGVGKRTAYAWAQDPKVKAAVESYRRWRRSPGDRPEWRRLSWASDGWRSSPRKPSPRRSGFAALRSILSDMVGALQWAEIRAEVDELKQELEKEKKRRASGATEDPTRDRPAPSRAHGGRLRRATPSRLRLVRRVLSVRRGPGHVQGNTRGPGRISWPPDGDWTTWLFLAGRGAGKSRSVTEWVRHQVEAWEGRTRSRLVAPTAADVRATSWSRDPRGYWRFPRHGSGRMSRRSGDSPGPNGATATTFSAHGALERHRGGPSTTRR